MMYCEIIVNKHRVMQQPMLSGKNNQRLIPHYSTYVQHYVKNCAVILMGQLSSNNSLRQYIHLVCSTEVVPSPKHPLIDEI